MHSLMVPMRGKHGVVLRSMSFVKPSSWMRFLLDHPAWFHKLLLGSSTNAERSRFWACAREIPEWSFLVPPDEASPYFLPFKLHGDKGPYYKNRSLQVFSISSLFAHSGDSTHSRLALCDSYANNNYMKKLSRAFFSCKVKQLRYDSWQIHRGYNAQSSWHIGFHTELFR